MSRSRRRLAFIHNMWAAFLASAGLLAVLIGLLMWGLSPGETQTSLTVYCAAGMKAPVEIVARDYERAFGVTIQLQYDGSATLLAGIEVSKRGDLYLPADDYYIRLAQEKKLLDDVIPLAEMHPVIAVAKGNPKKVQSLEPLLTGQVRLSLASPEAAAAGKLTRDALSSAQWESLKKHARATRLTVNEVANDITLGAVDAGIVWDATVTQYPGLEMVSCAELGKTKAHVCVAVLKTSRDPAAALAFTRYLAARDKGQVEFKRSGFQTMAGKDWADSHGTGRKDRD
jgi:molybdate transport system substrate-binding protein